MRFISIFVFFGMMISFYACKHEKGVDNSLQLEEYRNLGMPHPDKVWRLNDFALAKAVLENMKSTRPYQLPIKDSNKSGMLFDRMISMENMDFLDVEMVPGIEKLSLSNRFLHYCEDWINLYTFPEKGKQYYHQELTDVYLFGLKVTEIMLRINHQIQNSAESNDMYYEEQGEAIKSIYLSGLFNLLRVQSNASQFSSKDLEVIAKRVYNSIEENRIWMDEEIQKDLQRKLQVVIDSTSSKCIKERYINLKRSL